jgi:uncharacterized SAM-binding protein YcdF (DUF218 family)
MAIPITAVRGVCLGAAAIIAITSLASARNCRPILDDHGLSTALNVSHYYHLARCKLAFAEQRVSCTTVPARISMRLCNEPYFVLRECVAYLTYSVSRPFRRCTPMGE